MNYLSLCVAHGVTPLPVPSTQHKPVLAYVAVCERTPQKYWGAGITGLSAGGYVLDVCDVVGGEPVVLPPHKMVVGIFAKKPATIFANTHATHVTWWSEVCNEFFEDYTAEEADQNGWRTMSCLRADGTHIEVAVGSHEVAQAIKNEDGSYAVETLQGESATVASMGEAFVWVEKALVSGTDPLFPHGYMAPVAAIRCTVYDEAALQLSRKRVIATLKERERVLSAEGSDGCRHQIVDVCGNMFVLDDGTTVPDTRTVEAVLPAAIAAPDAITAQRAYAHWAYYQTTAPCWEDLPTRQQIAWIAVADTPQGTT